MKKISHLLLLGALLLLPISCIQEHDDTPYPPQPGEGELVPVSFTFGAQPETRAAGNPTDLGPDDQVDNIWILQYEETSGTGASAVTLLKQVQYVTPEWDNVDQVWTTTAPLEGLTGSTYQIYCLANTNNPTLFADPTFAGFETVDQLKQLAKRLSVANAENEMWKYSDDGGQTYRPSLMMNGVARTGGAAPGINVTAPSVTITLGTPQTLSVQLYRLCARVSFTFTNQYSVEGRELTVRNVRLKNVPAKVGYFASATLGTDDYVNYKAENVNDSEKGKNYTYTWFVPHHELADNTVADAAGNKATYIEVVGFDNTRKAVTYSFYPHATTGGGYNFDLPAGSAFTYQAELKGSKATSLADKKHYSIRSLDCIVIPETMGGANCFVLRSNSGAVSFPLTQVANYNAWLVDQKGATEPVLADENTDAAGWTAEVLWMDSPNLVKLIKNEGKGITDEYVLVELPTEQVGNAVIAVRNTNDEIVWSWHLWILKDNITTRQYSPYNKVNGLPNSNGTANDDQNLTPSSYTFTIMDYNLGATQAAALPGAEEKYGLFYQWGRKDPFIRTASAYLEDGSVYDFSKDNFPVGGYSKSAELSVQSPDIFYITGTDYWRSSTYGSKDDNLGANAWGGKTMLEPKSLFDPCPKGYRVLSSNSLGTELSNSWNWRNLSGSTNLLFQRGYDFSTITRHDNDGTEFQATGPGVWVAAGNRRFDTASLENLGFAGNVWYNTQASSGLAHLFSLNSSAFTQRSHYSASSGYSVRCVADYASN